MRRIVTSLLLCAAPLCGATEFSWNTEVDGSLDSGAGSRFGSHQMNLDVPLERYSRGRESLSTDFHLDLTKFSWQGTTAAEGDYFWVSVPIFYRQKRQGGSELHVRFEPGIMTDFDAMGTENLGVNAEVSGRTYLGRTEFVQYGLIVDRRFGDMKPRPTLSWATRLTDSTEMLLGFPNTNIQTRWSDEMSTFVRIYPAGGFWREEVDDLETPAVSDVSYVCWHMGIGTEFRWRANAWVSAEIGQLRNRTIQADDATAVSLSGDPGENGYWRLGGSLRF
ncbi:hypothetical protein [Thalassolituus sp.]|uniref:hypothetical protein n=1 Tax=Thalassolituus sp. TaxID=2030822 RepID=UPI00260EAB41|nr:hypothetical protein [uncultured Thalassolituus sp.]